MGSPVTNRSNKSDVIDDNLSTGNMQPGAHTSFNKLGGGAKSNFSQFSEKGGVSANGSSVSSILKKGSSNAPSRK